MIAPGKLDVVAPSFLSHPYAAAQAVDLERVRCPEHHKGALAHFQQYRPTGIGDMCNPTIPGGHFTKSLKEVHDRIKIPCYPVFKRVLRLIDMPDRNAKDLLRIPPLDPVRGFVAVGRRLSISRAAEDLCVTQSAVSKQIRVLENYLGTRLLLRKHRAIELTSAGERFFQRMDLCFQQLVDATASVRVSGERQAVTLTASIGVTSLWLLPRLGRFQQQNPAIDVRVAANNKLVDLAGEGIDLAIRYCPRERAPEDATWLFGEVIAPVAHASLAKQGIDTTEMLANVTLLEYDDASRPWLRWEDWLSTAGLGRSPPKSILHFNQYDQVVQAAISGQGIALGRLALVKPMLDDGRLVILVSRRHPRATEYAYWLIRSDKSSEPAEQFAAWIEAEAAQSSSALELQ